MIRLVYINPDSFFDTDLSVLKYLAAEFKVIWYPIYYTDRKVFYTAEQLEHYATVNGIEIHLSPRLYRQRDIRNLRVYSGIVKDINAHRPDIVFSCITEELWWTLAAKKLSAGTKILGVHDVEKHTDCNVLKRFIQGAIHDFSIRSHQNCCVFSESQKLLFTERYGRLPAVLGLGTKDFGDSTLTPPDIKDGVHLLFFGNIARYKGLDLLIAALEKLRGEGISNLHLTIAGKGDDWNDCKTLIETDEMYNLKIRFIENGEIPDLFCSHHFLTLPYRDATQSGPVAIAANYGLPILAPDFGCFAEQYDRSASVLYDNLENGLRVVASMGVNEYEQLRMNALCERARNSQEKIAGRYVELFSRLSQSRNISLKNM